MWNLRVRLSFRMIILWIESNSVKKLFKRFSWCHLGVNQFSTQKYIIQYLDTLFAIFMLLSLKVTHLVKRSNWKVLKAFCTWATYVTLTLNATKTFTFWARVGPTVSWPGSFSLIKHLGVHICRVLWSYGFGSVWNWHWHFSMAFAGNIFGQFVVLYSHT